MKIMISTDLAPPYVGGGESYVINVASGIAKLGHEVHWLTSRIPNTTQEEEYSGIKIHRVFIFFAKHFKFPGRLTYAFTSIPAALNLAKKTDVLQFNTFVAGTTGWLIAKLASKPSVLFCHEFFGHKWKHLGQNIIERNFYPYVEKFMAHMPYDAFACPSEYSKQTLLEAGADERKIHVVPHGIDFAIFNPESKASGKSEELRIKHSLEKYKLFGFTGRLSIKKVGHSKNILGLLKAAKIVMEKVPDARLVLGGTGYENILPAIRELGIEDKTIYLGERPREEVPHFFNVLDVVVCPALAEGFCFMIGEALACGRPSVATALGAHNERIIHEDTGILTKEDPQELADAIIKILNDPAIGEKFGRRAVEESKKLTWENSVNKHLEIYQCVIEKRKKK
jgi:glycosyltransferase involved in cell wall biosynthesis